MNSLVISFVNVLLSRNYYTVQFEKNELILRRIWVPDNSYISTLWVFITIILYRYTFLRVRQTGFEKVPFLRVTSNELRHVTFVALRPNFWRLLYGVRKVLDSPLHCILLWISFGFAKVRNYRNSLHKRRLNRYVRYDENRSDFRSSNDRFEVDFEHFEVHRHQCNTWTSDPWSGRSL